MLLQVLMTLEFNNSIATPMIGEEGWVLGSNSYSDEDLEKINKNNNIMNEKVKLDKKEAKKIADPEIDFVGFSSIANKPYADLTKKYMKLIHEVVEAS